MLSVLLPRAERKKRRGEKIVGNTNSHPTKSAGNVRLSKDAELMLLQDLFGNIVILHTQAKNGFALRMRDKGVEVIHIELGFEQGGHEVVQFGGGIDLDGQQITLGKWKVVVDQEASRPIRVVHHKPNDSTVRGVQHRQSEHMDSVRRQHADQVVQPSEPVRSKHRELSDGLSLTGGSGFRHI